MKGPVRKKDAAVSEVVGSVLLIALVVIASSIIAVALFSQPMVQKIPSLSALISNQSQTVYIKHVGGDALLNGTYEILVDGSDVTATIATPALWSIGNTLTYVKPGITPPSVVQVVYTGAGAPVVIAVSYFGVLPAGGKGIYMITASTGAGGSITPSGAVPVTFGANQTFSITNNTGYYISGVWVDGVSNGTIASYTFTNVTASHTILASFAQNPVITASATTGGTITPSGQVSVNYGGNQTFAIANNTGYYIAGVQVDGSQVGAVTSYNFTNVVAAHTINATFATTSVNINATASSGGVISPNGTVPVPYGGNQTFAITNNTGYYIAGVLVDGVSQGRIANYTFADVTAAHTISATFAQNPVITSSAGSGGTISPSGNVSVDYGGSQVFSIMTNTGYSVSNVTVDGSPLGAVPSYTFTNVTISHNISANFTINTFNITASATSGGIISPNGTITATYGSSQTFTITPNLGQNIVAVMVDGVNQGSVSSYTFTNITASHTIAASFVQIQNTITASAGTGGTIAPSGAVSVYYGTNQSFTITNNTGYYVANVLVDGSSVGSVKTYTFTNVIASHTISASFAQNPVITASAGSGGTISPSGTVSVDYGGSQTFTITPNTGYHATSVLVDSVSQGAITTYTFSNVQAPHTISATFAINTYAITATSGANGAVTPAGVTNGNYGGSQTYTITPNTGYSVSSVLVDGVSQGAITTYTFSNVQATHTISATFVATLTVTSISPTSGPRGGGTAVTITGTGFTSTSTVKFGTTAATSVTYVSSTQIKASSPQFNNGGTVDITVTTNGITSATSVNDQFTYTGAVPSVTSISPTSGSTAGGTLVTITGTGFTSASTVKFGTTAATSVTYVSSTSLTATSPAYSNGGTVDVTVTTTGGTSATSVNDQFTYTGAVPSVTSISPISGSKNGGTSVTITGTGFTSASTVKFGTTAATSVTYVSSTSLTATSPAYSNGGTVDVTVTTTGGTSATSVNDRFTYTGAVPSVTSISPTSGSTAGGTLVTITGTGFTSASTVKFGTTAGTSVTFVSNTQITVISPSHAAGTVDVKVTTTGGTSTVVTGDKFTYS